MLVVGEEFRAGNDSPGTRNLEFIRHCVSQMPKGKRIACLRSDSAAYQAAIFNDCEAEGRGFAIGADLDSAVLGVIAAIPEDGWRPYQNGHIAETVYTMNATRNAFRLVVIRRPVQLDMFKGEEAPLRYKAIASNRDESAEETVAWYNRRGETSENRLKELKLGFAMERMPRGDRSASPPWRNCSPAFRASPPCCILHNRVEGKNRACRKRLRIGGRDEVFSGLILFGFSPCPLSRGKSWYRGFNHPYK